MVSPSDQIIFSAYLSDQTSSNGMWLKTKDHSITKIQSDNNKYFTYRCFINKNHKLEILNADREDSGTYQFVVGDLKSNQIRTIVDGNHKY